MKIDITYLPGSPHTECMTTNLPKLGISVLEDDELVRKARAAENGRRFELLFDHGWESSAVRKVYEKPRHARLALINHLIWWARHDTDQVRRLFRRSALCPGDLTRYRSYFVELVRSAVALLGRECYDPGYTTADEEGSQ